MHKVIIEDLEKILQKGNIEWEVFRNKTILVTGAYGMIASYIVFLLLYLNKIGYNIKILATGRSYEKFQNRFGELSKEKNLIFIKNNIIKPLNEEKKIHYIIHGASLASANYYGTIPVDVILPNVVGTINTLELAKKNCVEGYLFLSSGDVYGETNQDVIKEEYCGNMDPTNIRNCYGESKRIGETLCVAYNTQYKIPTKIVRLAHTYGPTMDLEHDIRVFSEFVSNIKNKKDIIMKSDGQSSRTFCYLGDALEAMFLVLTKGLAGQAYNICNAAGRIKIGELANLLIKLFPEKKLKIIYQFRKEGEEYLESKNIIAPILNSDKLFKLGFTFSTSLEEGFYRTIKSFE